MARILVADDSMTSRMILKRCIEMAGLRGSDFAEARDGEEALAAAALSKPDLIVADFNMPRMDGEALLAALKADPATAAIPVIIATSANNPERAAVLARLGAVCTLGKPVSPAAFKTALAGLAVPGGPA